MNDLETGAALGAWAGARAGIAAGTVGGAAWGLGRGLAHERGWLPCGRRDAPCPDRHNDRG